MKQVEYAVCPCCGMNKVVKSATRVQKGKPEMLDWADFDVSKMMFIQVREGGGRASGFHKVKGGMTLQAAILAGGVYYNTAYGMAKQLQKALAECKRLGLVP